MVETKPDGGPAFPHREYESRPFYHGMSLRDWFAGQALVGWIAGPCQGDALADYDGSDPSTIRAWRQHTDKVALAAYDYADALLAAREAK